MLDWAPELLIDDGSHLIRLAHTERRAALATLRAASEETTSGVRPLIEMAAEEELRIPVIAVNDARTKSEFDNRVGTGQSCVFAIANLLDTEAANTIRQDPANPTSALNQGFAGVSGSHWVVVGYGPVGVGVARFAAALGARITVVERDAVRALQALHDGHEAGSLDVALPLADVAVSATGVWHTLGADDLALLRPGAAVAVAGGIDDELALDELRARHWRVDEVAPHVATWQAPGANGPPGFIVLADGAGVNYTAGEGNPIEVMDLSFATQLASLARIASGGDGPGVHTLDQAAERRVAQAALTAQGASVDPAPTDARPGGAAQHWTAHRYRSGRERSGVA
jgi:adenosylhomocysteinase